MCIYISIYMYIYMCKYIHRYLYSLIVQQVSFTLLMNLMHHHSFGLLAPWIAKAVSSMIGGRAAGIGRGPPGASRRGHAVYIYAYMYLFTYFCIRVHKYIYVHM